MAKNKCIKQAADLKSTPSLLSGHKNKTPHLSLPSPSSPHRPCRLMAPYPPTQTELVTFHYPPSQHSPHTTLTATHPSTICLVSWTNSGDFSPHKTFLILRGLTQVLSHQRNVSRPLQATPTQTPLASCSSNDPYLLGDASTTGTFPHPDSANSLAHHHHHHQKVTQTLAFLALIHSFIHFIL